MKTKILFILVLSFSLFFQNSALAAIESQCQTGRDGGQQTGCTHSNDEMILENQCRGRYEGSSCTNMQSYLNAMATDCDRQRPSGIDCSMITQNGIYGREASKFANYTDENDYQSPSNQPSANTTYNSQASTGWNVASIKIFQLPESTIWEIVTNLFFWLMTVFSLLGIIGFIVSGLMYLTSGGDDKQMESAKKMAQYSGYGIAVGLSGLVIMQAIFWALNGSPIF